MGFFANRNHFATYINCGIVFAIAWILELASGVRRDRARRPIVLIAALTGIVVLIAAAAMARSRAGLAGTAVALILGFALAVRTNRTASDLSPGKILGAAVIFSLLLALQFALYRVLDRFAADPLKDARADFARVTFDAIKAYFPFGSGVGTFTRVYPSFETPQHALLDTFVNRAHNDFVEFALETGIFGGLLLAAIGLFAIWLAWAAWTRNDKAATSIDATLMRAASIALGIIAMHSAVDYPLRTASMIGVAAMLMALLLEPHVVSTAREGSPQGHREPEAASKVERDLAIERAHDADVSSPILAPSSERKAWRPDVEWPEEWRKK